ncbi:MAG: ATP-dependent Clp protease ATP-binding subunit ClpA [Pyrinomonadaceae bacterium]|nr:ATP-dependent Clp protease ATP-binding subunit ClpA [Pyrinomonadaceae bacterium]MCX7640675.1 ATP-dependent Clp protease ATP-binding subunit ClpA [Pyrinomonadaceae bacterium]MDW8305359.1 ATP-dependent Clp protease ATP-binding subunit ClpA [Acidobacteriota bacterium]
MSNQTKLSKELEETLNAACEEAMARRHEYVTLEHLLYAMLGSDVARDILYNCGVNLSELKKDLENYFSEAMEKLPEGFQSLPELTTVFQSTVQNAILQAESSGQQVIDSGNVLAAMFQNENSYAVYLLKSQGVTRLDILNYISHGISKVGNLDEGIRKRGKHNRDSEEDDFYGEDISDDLNSEDDFPPLPHDLDDFIPYDEDEDFAEERLGKVGREGPLESFAVELVEKARQGKIDPIVGREVEIERTIQVLCRRKKNNPMYVGEPGVGKTALAEGLALRIAKGEVPEVLRGAKIYALDLGGLVAGTRYRGDFEQRLKSLINALKKQSNAILFIDEIHTVIGAGSASGTTLDASNILKPFLASGEIRCIGATTYAEYKTLERDKALIRRFQKIEVGEPSIEETYEILKGLRRFYEKYHNVRYSNKALRAAAELAGKYINDRHLPDKAIDVIDEVGAAVKLMPKEKRPKVITVPMIEEVVAKMAKIPPRSVVSDEKQKLKTLREELKAVIFGQDEAIDKIVDAIQVSRAGLNSENKPIGSFLFSGPTGVGKTELSKQLARILGVEFIRFDMSEYSESHSVSRLIGAPPGYVGFNQGGLLTDAVIRNPHSVLLLDEIEKAHPNLFNLLLQVMDSAILTDNNGRKADFRNVILIMTTNAGARELSIAGVGFRKRESRGNARGAIERTFPPEFLNRLNAWVAFKPLSLDVIQMIVDKFIREVNLQVAAKNVEVVVDEAARTWLAERGFDPKYGARPMARIIHEKMKLPLAREMLFGSLAEGGKMYVTVDGGELSIRFEENVKA